jgi:hypothetical protein
VRYCPHDQQTETFHDRRGCCYRPRAARSVQRRLHVRDEGRLHETSYSGSEFHEEGQATGTLPGKLYASFNYTGASLTVTAQFTLMGNGWSLTGHGTGTLHNANSASPSFSGPFRR